ncbi:hypothetical protein N0V88_003162 [Collariella sp. IMI 366227]|nr:hypothetical protein N0V88_003162 [Collariella sp. IMI 366227]
MPNAADRGFNIGRLKDMGSVSTSTGLLSNVPYSSPGSSNVFGIGSEHPFANYWTCEGGLPEVISVLPDKLQADILLARYFECVDPVYPMLHRQTFYADYEHFWSLSRADKDRSDAGFVALIFVMLAMGTQFVTSTLPKERKQTAEFYASASNQALRMCSYLSTASIKTIQAMVLITYFLINDNHASDGWAFAGILMRQAYAMGLHRDPNIATHTDVSVDDLALDTTSSIASDDPTDTAYIRGSWTLANLVQETICSPRSSTSPSAPRPATSPNSSRTSAPCTARFRMSFGRGTRTRWRRGPGDKRVVRQTLFLSNRMIQIMRAMSDGDQGSETARTRVQVLSEFLI